MKRSSLVEEKFVKNLGIFANYKDFVVLKL